MSQFNIDATHWLLISSRNSKYAHAPVWSASPWASSLKNRTACGKELTARDEFTMTNDDAKGKLPCPRCIQQLRHQSVWIAEFAEAYARLTWEEKATS